MSDDFSIWAALADAKRRQIVNLLEERPRTTSELCESFDVSRFAIMKHLKVLEQARLIQVRREGRKRWNLLNEELVHFLRTRLADDTSSYRLADILAFSRSQKLTSPKRAAPLCVEQQIALAATPAEVFAAWTTDINGWWPIRSAAESQIIVEPYVNGRFYEAINEAGQGVLYATVTSIKPCEELRFRGTLELAELVTKTAVFDSFVRIGLVAEPTVTQLYLSHHLANGVDELAYTAGKHYWHNALNQHLKPFVEKGIPYQHNP